MPTFDDGGVATFQPSTTYNLTVEATDLAGNAMPAPFPFSFTTASPPDTTPPTLVSSLPVDMATAIPVNTSIVLTFSEPMNSATVEATLRFNGSVRPGTYTWNSNFTTVRFTPTSNWTNSTAYTISFNPPPQDNANNPMTPATRSFTTNTVTDTTAATVVSRVPATGATGVATRTGCSLFRNSTTVTLTFSSAVDRVSTSAAFSVLDGSTVVPGTISFDATGTILTFTPRAAFSFDTLYSVRLNDTTNIARDLQMNPMANVNYTFRTMREVTTIIFNTPSTSGRILSGTVLGQSTVASNVAIRVGEFNSTVRSRGHVSFDLSAIPSNVYCVNATTLQLEQTGVNGTPYGASNLGDLVAEVVNMGALDATDYSAAALPGGFLQSNATVLSTDPSFGNKTAQVAHQVRSALGQLVPSNVRWRLRFTNDTMSMGTVDNASFQNTTVNGRLVVRYEAP